MNVDPKNVNSSLHVPSPFHDPAFQALYDPIETIGRGGMGNVERIRHRVWEHDLAAKIPLPSMVAQAGGLEQFRREAETWVRFPLHPNIVTCHYVRVFGGVPVIFIEYIKGGSVADAIQESRIGRDTTEALNVALGIAFGLDLAHEKGIIHQDIKPSNVLLDNGKAKVTDFGIANNAAVAHASTILLPQESTLMATALGMTPLYASPEQLAALYADNVAQTRITRATDVWSLGLTLLEMLMGKVVWKPGAVPDNAFGYFDNDVGAMLRGMLDSDPAMRPKMHDVIGMLREALSKRGVVHEAPKLAELRADGLNNRAISILDLGALDEARKLLREALSIDPCHAEAVFNETLLAWRAGEITDIGALERVRQTLSSASSWETALFEAWIEIERGDETGAWSVLDRVADRGAGAPRATRAVARASRAVRETIREVASFRAHNSIADAFAVTADERYVVTGGRDRKVRVFELQTGKMVQEMLGHEHYVMDVVLTRDTKRMYTVGWDGTIRAFDLPTGKELWVVQQPGKLNHIVLSPDEQYVYTSSLSGTLYQWRVSKAEGLLVSKVMNLPNDQDIESIALSPEGTRLVVGALDQIHVFTVPQIKLLTIHELPDRPESIAFLPKSSRTICVGTNDQRVFLHDLTSGNRLGEMSGMYSSVRHIAISKDERWAVCNNGLNWSLWDMDTRRCIRTYTAPKLITGAVFLQNGELVTLDWGGSVRRYRIEPPSTAPFMAAVPRQGTELTQKDKRCKQLIENATKALTQNRMTEALEIVRKVREVPGFERSPDILALWERLVNYFQIASVRAIWPVAHYDNVKGPSGLIFIPQHNQVVTANGKGDLEWRSLPSGEMVHTLQFDSKELQSRSLALSGDGRFIAVGTYERVHVLNAEGHPLWKMNVGKVYIRSVCFSPSSELLAVLDGKGNAYILNVNDGAYVCMVRSHETWVEAAAFIGESMLAVGDYAGNLFLWDLGIAAKSEKPDQEEINSPEPSKALIANLAADGPDTGNERTIHWIKVWDNDELLFASADGTVHVVDIVTKAEKDRYIGHSEPVSNFDFIGNTHLITVGFDNLLRVFERKSRKCIAVYEGHTHPIRGVSMEDVHHALTLSDDNILQRLYIDWDMA